MVKMPSPYATGADASIAAQPRSAAIITGRLRTRSTQTPAGMPPGEGRQPPRRSKQRDLIWLRVEHEEGRQRQREKGDLADESADGLRAPETQKVPVLPKSAQTHCSPLRGQYIRRTTGRDVVRHRRDAT